MGLYDQGHRQWHEWHAQSWRSIQILHANKFGFRSRMNMMDSAEKWGITWKASIQFQNNTVSQQILPRPKYWPWSSMATHIAIAICITIEITVNSATRTEWSANLVARIQKLIYKTTKKGLWIVQLHNFSLHPKAGVILTWGPAKLTPEAGLPCFIHSANLNLHVEYCQDILINTRLNPRYTEKCLLQLFNI